MAEVEQTLAAGRRLSEGVLNETAKLIADFPGGTAQDLIKTTPPTPAPASRSSLAFDADLKSAC